MLDSSPTGVVNSLLNFRDLERELFKSDMSLSVEHRSQLLDLICDCFQQFLSALSSGAHSEAKRHFTLYARHLPLISLKGKQPGVCEEIDAMDKYGKWYQAFVIKSSLQSSLIHFMVSVYLSF